MAAGLIAALLFVAAPFIPAQESRITGAVLCGFALGWAMLALLSARMTDQPQRWALAPAVFMGAGGLLLLAFGSWITKALNWVWPPVLLALVVWMAHRVHRELRSPSRRLLLYPLLGVLALASVGGGYETVREALDANAFPMPGQLVDVGGHGLHLNCTGSGSPTVVLQPGGGDMSATMGWIAPYVAAQTRVCVYDRPGRGWSEPTDIPQDAARVSSDLHTLMHRANVPGPYVLAGHSFGGLYVLAYAAQYPNEVAGLVLVDSTAPKTVSKPTASSTAGGYDPVGRVSALLALAARVGLGRVYAVTAYGDLPPRSRDEVRASVSTADTLRSTIDEFAQANASMEQAGMLTTFGDKPLVVLTAGSGSDAKWSVSQDHLAGLSTNAAHRVIAGAVHEDLVAKQAPAAQTAQAILDLVSAVRNKAPLAK